jgi:hypothetical protein
MDYHTKQISNLRCRGALCDGQALGTVTDSANAHLRATLRARPTYAGSPGGQILCDQAGRVRD